MKSSLFYVHEHTFIVLGAELIEASIEEEGKEEDHVFNHV
jgi:hypothetical protein